MDHVSCFSLPQYRLWILRGHFGDVELSFLLVDLGEASGCLIHRISCHEFASPEWPSSSTFSRSASYVDPAFLVNALS